MMKLLEKMRLGARLAWAFGLLLVLLVAMAAISVRQMATIHDALDYYASTTTPSLAAVKTWQDKVASIRMVQGQHLMTVSADEMDILEAKIAEAYAQLNQELAAHEKLLVNDEDRELWTAVTEATQRSMSDWDKLKAVSRESLADPEKIEEARRLFTGKSERLFRATLDAIDKEWSFKSGVAAQLADKGAAVFQLSLTTQLAASVLAIVLGILAAWLVMRSVTRQMGGEPKDVATIALSIAKGDLTTQVHTGARDRNSVMAAMATMRQQLAELVGEVRQGSDSIASSSAEIASGNLDLSQRTEQQANDLQRTVASVEQLAETVKHSAETAEQANRLAANASSAAQAGGQSVTQVVATMQDIAASSRTISEITGVIDGIAFQTNILALNAAVEAARAGEQGRGFAVVAGEVRSLAQRSAEAAKQIKQLIGDNVSKVETGVSQVHEAGESIHRIVDQVHQVSGLIEQIHSATTAQYQGIHQVSDAIGRIDQATLQNAALVEQSSAAAESLRQQADRLARLVGVFRLQLPGPAAYPALSET